MNEPHRIDRQRSPQAALAGCSQGPRGPANGARTTMAAVAEPAEQPRAEQPAEPALEEKELEDYRNLKSGELNEVPTFRPNEAEFENFEAYMSRADVWASGMCHGIVKIQPPKEWMARQHDYEKEGIPQHILDTVIPTPAQQLPNGRKGIYECASHSPLASFIPFPFRLLCCARAQSRCRFAYRSPHHSSIARDTSHALLVPAG